MDEELMVVYLAYVLQGQEAKITQIRAMHNFGISYQIIGRFPKELGSRSYITVTEFGKAFYHDGECGRSYYAFGHDKKEAVNALFEYIMQDYHKEQEIFNIYQKFFCEAEKLKDSAS